MVGGPASIAVPVTDASQVGEARRAAMAAGERAALSSDELGRLALITTETAANLARHARDGVLLVRNFGDGAGNGGVEVLALDRGPGIADLTRAMEDGYSTAGTPGKGLGAIRRLAGSGFGIMSAEHGTALVARVRGSRAQASAEIGAGVVCLQMPGEVVCGDAWYVNRTPVRTLVVIADGLGHGPEAAVAATTAIRIIEERPDDMPGALIAATHNALRSTRGAAISIARIDHAARMLTFAGIGNVAGVICETGQTRSMAPHGGIVGHQLPRVREFQYPWPEGGNFVMHSDGVSARWRPDSYPGVLDGDAALLAGVLFRDFSRGRDDATVVVVRDLPN
jgi:anti-sigma regulatory factor (Ser/Thr protein kinase)